MAQDKHLEFRKRFSSFNELQNQEENRHVNKCKKFDIQIKTEYYFSVYNVSKLNFGLKFFGLNITN